MEIKINVDDLSKEELVELLRIVARQPQKHKLEPERHIEAAKGIEKATETPEKSNTKREVVIPRFAIKGRRRWTQTETDTLKKEFNAKRLSLSCKNLAKLLNRTPAAIYTRAIIIGIYEPKHNAKNK